MTTDAVRESRRSERGQVLALFALFAVLLFVVSGLAVDAGMSYLTSDRVERAAAAAALAGVAYLPGDYTDAQNAALVEAARNGFNNAGSGNACTGNPSPCVTTSEPATNQLQVTISVSVQTTFLRLVGFGAHTVSRSETAEYLPPIQLGQPGFSQGSDLESPCDGINGDSYCNSPSSGLGSGGNNYYFERVEGWGNERSQGDPFTPSPDQTDSVCGSSGSGSCVASPADYHEISPAKGTEPAADSANYAGGSNYLIDVKPGKSVDVQVFNPSFAPDDNDQSFAYSLRESDGMTSTGAGKEIYAAMRYTLFKVNTLDSRASDTQVITRTFYPFNATGDYQKTSATGSVFWFPPSCPMADGTACTVGSKTTVSGLPSVYHQWVSMTSYSPTVNIDKDLYDSSASTANISLLTNSSSTVDAYWRLEVDTLQWNAAITCDPTNGCTAPATATSSYSQAHKGYAVRITPGTSTAVACTTATCGSSSVSAMDDMVVYTPIKTGSTAQDFSIPLFLLDSAYAGKTITVDLFDPGDVSGGNAYMGIQQPDGNFASASSITLLGPSLGAGGTSSVTSLGTWPGTTSTTNGGACTACFQTANSGGVIYNGEWLQLEITVPTSFSGGSSVWNSYWNLVYSVQANVTTTDTFGVQVGYDGSPDHLLP